MTLPFADVVSALLHRAGTTPDARAYVFLGDGDTETDTRTWAELRDRAGAAADLLRAHTAPGDRVLLAFPEGLPFLDALFGCLGAGRIAVPVHAPEPARWDRTAPRLLAVAADARPSLVLTDPTLVDALARALPGVRVLPLPSGSGLLEVPSPAALASLQYTSGSTAEPKGVRLTHHHLAWQLTDFDAGYGHVAGDALVSWLPATHDLGLVYGRLMASWVGMVGVGFPPAAFVQRPARWLRALSTYRATHSASPNFGFELAARRSTSADLVGVDLRSVRVLVNGAEPIRPESEAAFQALAGPLGLRAAAITHALGMSETTAKVCSEPVDRAPARFLWLEPRAYEQCLAEVTAPSTPRARVVASNGSTRGDTVVLAVDPATSDVLGEGRVGELWIGGTTVADGYWDRPDDPAFRAFTADGRGPFLRSGDLGFLRDGEVYVSGRRKDVIIVRGQNHHPPDLERALESAHPSVRAGCVVAFGVPGPEGEGVGVVAEVAPDAPLADVAAALRASLSDQGLAPAVLALVEPRGVTKTSSGKLARRETARRLLSGELQALYRVDATPSESVAPLPERARILAAPARRRAALVESSILALVAARLGVDAGDVDPDRPFKELGLDSVAAVELGERAGAALGLTVAATALFDHPTPAALAAFLVGQIR